MLLSSFVYLALEIVAKPDPNVQWPEEKDGHAASIFTGSISPILVMIGGVDKVKKK